MNFASRQTSPAAKIRGFVVAALLTASDYGLWGVLVVLLSTLLWLKQAGVNEKYIQQQDHDQQLAFQRVDDYRAPQWPGQEVPQQMHIDVDVDDLDEAEAAVLALGATKHDHQPGTTFRVFLDPAGHTFCLCLD